MHNDFTLALLEYTTALLGAQIRLFHKKTCSSYDTRETQKEAEARGRRGGKGGAKGGRKRVQFDVYTIKLHFLGDYVNTIRQFGTTDSYSTETVSSSHSERQNATRVEH